MMPAENASDSCDNAQLLLLQLAAAKPVIAPLVFFLLYAISMREAHPHLSLFAQRLPLYEMRVQHAHSSSTRFKVCLRCTLRDIAQLHVRNVPTGFIYLCV